MWGGKGSLDGKDDIGDNQNVVNGTVQTAFSLPGGNDSSGFVHDNRRASSSKPSKDHYLFKCRHCGADYLGRKNGMGYCSFKCKQAGKGYWKPCAFCGEQFYAPERRTESKKYCSVTCSNRGPRYGNKQNYEATRLAVIGDLDRLIPSKTIAKNRAIPCAFVRRVLKEEYADCSPIAKAVIRLYEDGKTESEIAIKLCRQTGEVITWLMHGLVGYQRPSKKRPETVESLGAKMLRRGSEERNRVAALLRRWRSGCKVKDLMAENAHANSMLLRSRVYRQISQARRAASPYTRACHGRRERSKLFPSETKDFIPVVVNAMTANGWTCIREERVGLGRRRCDIWALKGDRTLIVQCKVETKATCADEVLGQALVAGAIMRSAACVCIPSDVAILLGYVAVAQSLGVGVFTEQTIVSA